MEIEKVLAYRFGHNSFGRFSFGFTLLEMLLVIAIGAIISAIAINTFPLIAGGHALEKKSAIIVSLLDQARSQTLAGKNNLVYGVHFDTTKAVLFQGPTYFSTASSTNIVENIGPLTQISNVALSGGGVDVVFDKLTGRTSNNGTVEVSLVASPTQKKIITIFATGIIQMN